MKHLFITTLTFLIVISHIGYSQTKKDKIVVQEEKSSGSKKIEAKARQLFFYEDYKGAAELFEKLEESESDKTKHDYVLGVCYLHMHLSTKAEQHLQNAVKRKDSPVQVYYYLGKADHLANNFNDAIEHFQFYKDTLLQLLKNKIVAKDLELHAHNQKTVEEVDEEIKKCRVGKKLLENPLKDVVVSNAGTPLNSEYAEYTPVFTNNEDIMFINSRRPESKGTNDQEEDYFEDIFISYKVSNGWSLPVNIAAQINENFNTNFHDAVVSISHDGELLIMYRSSGGKNSNGDLYYCKLNDDEWSSPKPFPTEVNSVHGETSACFSDDANTMYFVSDRPGGKGGKDIYIIKKDASGNWGKATNMGDSINSKFDEEAPYITPDGKTFYFSSTGHENMGGFDIFKSTYDETTSTWSKPVNLGYPINSADHDIYIQWSLDGKTGYFTSIRPDTKGEKDIYKITGASEINQYIVLKGKVVDSESKLPLNAKISLYDLTNKKILPDLMTDSITGKYHVVVPGGVVYDVDVASVEHYIFEDSISIPIDKSINEVRKDVALKPFKLNEHVILKNIFFDFNSSNIRAESERELNGLYNMLAYNPSLKLEIGGHTDSVANDDYNLKLSEQRSASVVDYLIKKGIASTRLVSKGYGESQPIASNSTDEGRQLNRRTEFIITDIKFAEKRIVAKIDTAGALSGMKKNKINFFAGRSTLSQLELGHPLPESVHFPHFDSKTITDYSKRKADVIVEVMQKNPNLEIKIVSYSDQDELSKNSKISEERAKLVFDYLVSKGISKTRLKFEGADKLENQWAGYARRVEFFVEKL